MISVCASAEAVSTFRSSKERLQEELAARDAVIETLTRQMEMLQKKKEKSGTKKRKSSFIDSIARRFSFHQRKESTLETCKSEYKLEHDPYYDVTIVDHVHDGDQKSIPRSKSVSELRKPRPIDHLYNSCSIWNLSSSSCSMLLCDDVEYSLDDIFSGKSRGSINLDNEGCLLVYGCPKELVPLLDADFVAERERRWLLRYDFIEATSESK